MSITVDLAFRIGSAELVVSWFFWVWPNKQGILTVSFAVTKLLAFKKGGKRFMDGWLLFKRNQGPPERKGPVQP